MVKNPISEFFANYKFIEFYSIRNVLLCIQVSSGFLPILLFGTNNYIVVEDLIISINLISGIGFGLFSNSSSFLPGRFNSIWKDYFFGNIFIMFILFLLSLSLIYFFQLNYNIYNIGLAFCFSIKNSVIPILISLGLYKQALFKELFTFIILLFYFLFSRIFIFDFDVLIFIYFVSFTPYLLFIFYLINKYKILVKFDLKNWTAGYLDPLANSLLSNSPREIVLNSSLNSKDDFLFAIRIVSALYTFLGQFFWMRFNNVISKECYSRKYLKLKILFKFNAMLIFLSFLSVLFSLFFLSTYTLPVSILLLFLSFTLPMNFFRYSNSALNRSIYFSLISGIVFFLMSFNISFFLIFVLLINVCTQFYISSRIYYL